MIAFLNPWLWCGLLAIGVPIYLHLQRKDRESVQFFGAMRFLEDQPIVSRPPMRIRDILLFLLRCLALLLIVAGLSRPYFDKNAGGNVSSTVYLLDNSLSRQAGHGLDHDREHLLSLLGSATSRSQIAVVELAGQPKVLVNFSDTPDEARAKVAKIEPTSQRGSILAGLRSADVLLKSSIGAQKQIVVLSDLQKNQWSENISSPPFLAPGEVVFPSLPEEETRPNAYVQDPKAIRVFINDSSIVQVTATIGHTPGFAAEGTGTLTINDEVLSSHPVKIDEKMAQTSVTTQLAVPQDKWVLGSLNIETKPDELPGDNTAYFASPPLHEGHIAILSTSIYLNLALSGEIAKGHWITEKIEPTQLEAKIANPDQDADVLVIDGNYLQSETARQLARHYLQTGRGLFVCVGELSTLLDGFLEEMNFSPLTRLAPDREAPLEPIRYFASDSPVFKPFSSADFCNLLEVRVGDTVRLASKDAKPILFSQSGSPILFEGTKYSGHYLLATFQFDRSQTDWVLHPSFVPFLDLAIDSLRPQPNLTTAVEPGEVWQVKLPETCR